MVSKPIFCVFGEVGKGKSTFLNYLIDGRDSGRFVSGSSFHSVTTELKRQEGYIHKTNIKIVVYDTPGLLAGDISLDSWVSTVTKFNETFNGIIWVVSALDRATLSTSILAGGMQFLIKNFSFDSVILVITHCDLVKKNVNSKSLGDEWLNQINQNLTKKLAVKKIITFGVTETVHYKPKYAQEFSEMANVIGGSNMSFQKNIDRVGFGQQVIKGVGDNVKSEEQKEMERRAAEVQKQIEDKKKEDERVAREKATIQAQIQATQLRNQQLQQALANRPPPRVHHRRHHNDCSIF